jgi:uncharacterized protein
MRVIRAADCRRTSWKNGRGETTEIAASPPGAGLDEFHWRVSMARVARNGPFSSFEGVDRTLAILDGAGLRLDIAGRAPVELTAGSPPLSFPADLPATASLADGPVLDLNVMTRRGVVEHAVDRLALTGSRELRVDAAAGLVFCRSGSVEVAIGAEEATLRADDTLLVERSPAVPWALRAQPSAILFLIRLRPARPPPRG